LYRYAIVEQVIGDASGPYAWASPEVESWIMEENRIPDYTPEQREQIRAFVARAIGMPEIACPVCDHASVVFVGYGAVPIYERTGGAQSRGSLDAVLLACEKCGYTLTFIETTDNPFPRFPYPARPMY
jgi:hypothetical protein